MSIREVARELYRLEKEIERIEEALKNAGPKEKEELELKLKKVRAERDRAKAVLEGMKQSPKQKTRGSFVC